MDKDAALACFYKQSIENDYTDFIALLKELPEMLMYETEEFFEVFDKLYAELYKDGLAIVNTRISDKSGEDSGLPAAERRHRIQVNTAFDLAKDAYEVSLLDEKYRSIFINTIAHCLISRFKCVKDPMDHQIRPAIRPGQSRAASVSEQ